MRPGSARRLTAAVFVAIWSGQENAYVQALKVDLQPCIVANGALVKDMADVAEAYLFSELFKGFWGASQYVIIDTGDNELDLIYDNTDDAHGKCSAIFVGAKPSFKQYEQLTIYSKTFKVRVVYFDPAETSSMLPIMSDKLNIQQFKTRQFRRPAGIRLRDPTSRVVNPDLQTDPVSNGVYFRCMRVYGAPKGGTRTIVADLADSSGNTLYDASGIWNPNAPEPNIVEAGASVAAVIYTADDGSEEMHVFFAMGWFDTESWAWSHYFLEWGTQGVFQGERRFWLGAMVDGHFLGTPTFEYSDDPSKSNLGPEVRTSGDDLRKLLKATKALNAKYNAEIVTEFPFNGFGILEETESAYGFTFADADAALLYKGLPPSDNGDGTFGLPPTKYPAGWFNETTVDGMRAEYLSGKWNRTDDLLLASLELKNDFFWQSHTLSNQARDNLGEVDCQSEDGGNSQIAIITGLYDANTYGWRSMTTPGITGLFNKNCLKSAMEQKITCAPGDNTWDGIQTNISLVSEESQFHSIYSIEETHGLRGFQIVPRFATFVYYNCKTTDCLVLENIFIRRTVCGCDDLDPGDMSNAPDSLNLGMTGCDKKACPFELEAFGSVEELFETEAITTSRWIMNGRRDKYMMHQANVVPTPTPLGNTDISLLEYWYEVVLERIARYLNLQGDKPFPLKSVKFDDLCTNFKHHEDLDASNAIITLTKTAEGIISGMNLTAGPNTGVIPVTFPTSKVSEVVENLLPWYATETYGSDTTFYVASRPEDEPQTLPKLSSRDLPSVPSGTYAPTPAPTWAPIECNKWNALWCL